MIGTILIQMFKNQLKPGKMFNGLEPLILKSLNQDKMERYRSFGVESSLTIFNRDNLETVIF
jgi:hypothetical protein